MKVTKDRAIQRFQQNHPKTKEYDAFVKTQGASLQKSLQKMVDFAMKIPNKKNQAKYIDNEVRDIERELVKKYEKQMKKEEVVLKTFKDLREEKKKTAVFTFGRFNPPTIGHEKLIDKVSKVAGSNSYFIYPSHSQNTKKDPLPQSLKIAYMRSMFPKHAKKIIAGTEKNVFDIAVSLYNKGFTDIEMVVGSDRIREFHKILSKYNGLQGRHGFYDFKTVTVTSAGDRDPDADGVKGMSASKMRGAALSNDFETFKSGLPKSFGHAQKMFKDIRKYMKVVESFNTISPTLTEEDVIRDMYLENKIYNIGDIVEDVYTGVSGEIIRRGTNYLVFAEEDGTTHKKWLFEIQTKEDCWPGFQAIGMKMKNGKKVPNCVPVKERKTAQDKDIKDREGSQPAKYYKGITKSTKDDRARHFEKGAKKSDDDPSAYKPAPGDAGAKTKLSKYTKAMRKKYPDLYKESADSSLKKKAEKSGISFSILKKVYNRGVAAWRTGHRPGTTPQQWGHARVNSFMTGGKTRSTADKDLWQRHKGKSEEVNTADAMKRYKSGKAGFTDVAHLKAKGLIKRSDGTKKKSDKYEEGGAGDFGTDKLANKYKKDTPGQSVKSFTEFRSSCCEDCEQESDLIESNIYRVGSQKYFEYFLEKKKLYKENKLKVDNKFDIEILEGDIGEYADYEGKKVALDTPMFEEDDVELNKPKRGGPKKFYVYVKDPSTGNIKKVTWGDTTGLKVKLDDPQARKSFAARHKCDTRTDKTKASYWACRLPKYAKQLGLSGGGNFFW